MMLNITLVKQSIRAIFFAKFITNLSWGKYADRTLFNFCCQTSFTHSFILLIEMEDEKRTERSINSLVRASQAQKEHKLSSCRIITLQKNFSFFNNKQSMMLLLMNGFGWKWNRDERKFPEKVHKKYKNIEICADDLIYFSNDLFWRD